MNYTYVIPIKFYLYILWLPKDKDYRAEENDGRTPILVSDNGITEMVEKILEIYPMAILDADMKRKNPVLLVVEHRHTQLYEKLVIRKPLNERVLHLAATLSDYQPYPFAACKSNGKSTGIR